MANPVASPQPVVGIHFEVTIKEGLIEIPPVLFKDAYPSRADQRTDRGYSVTRSGQVYAAAASGGASNSQTGFCKNWKCVEEEE